MKTLAALSILALLLAPLEAPAWAAPSNTNKAAATSAIAAPPAKRTVGARIKAGWRKMGKFGQTAAVVLVSGAAAFGMHQAGMTPVETAATIGGTLSLGAGTMALIAQRAKSVWNRSLAAMKIKKLDDAHGKGSVSEVPTLLHELEAASAANARKSPASKKEQKQQELEASFLNLGIVRAELALNDAADGKGRLSGATLPAWKANLGPLDTEAAGKVTQTSEGKLALALADLREELSAENAVLTRHQQAITQFEDHVPAMFGGPMAKQAKVAKQMVSQLKDGEVGGEQSLHHELNLKMRGRVSDRIAGESTEFKTRRIRHGNLKTLREGTLGAALHEANRADDELASAISDRQQETYYEAQAMAHTHDTETYTDSNGKLQTKTVDNSGQYRSMAAMYGSSASSHASQANNAMENLAGHLHTLTSDTTMLSEKLYSPGHGGMSSAGGGPGWMSELYLPEGFNLFSNMMAQSNLSSARGAVGQKLGALNSLNDEVTRRETGELTWLDKQIDGDLSRQMTAAK